MEKPAERPALTPTPPSPDASGVVSLEDLIRRGGGHPSVTDERDILLALSTPLSGNGLDRSADELFAPPPPPPPRPFIRLGGQVTAMAAAALLMLGAAGAAAQLYQRMAPPEALAIGVTAEASPSRWGTEPALAFPLVDLPALEPNASPEAAEPAGREAPESVIVARAAVSPRPARPASAAPTLRRFEATTPPAIEEGTERPSAPAAGSFDELVGRAAGEQVGAGLPEAPTRDQIRAGFRPANTRVLACGGPSGETISTRILIDGPTGRVRSATVVGELAGTTVATCIEREIARSRFEAFADAGFEVAYPFRL